MFPSKQFTLFFREEKKVVKKVGTKTEEKKSYDWKKNVKKVEKKEATPEPKPEKVQLKKPKAVEKVKESAQEGPKLKPIPAKEKAEEEPKEEHKLKPVPQKPKQEEVCIVLQYVCPVVPPSCIASPFPNVSQLRFTATDRQFCISLVTHLFLSRSE